MITIPNDGVPSVNKWSNPNAPIEVSLNTGDDKEARGARAPQARNDPDQAA